MWIPAPSRNLNWNLFSLILFVKEQLKLSKSGRAVEYQRQIGQLENIFEEALDQSKRKFDQIDSQLSGIVDFLDVERKNKAQ